MVSDYHYVDMVCEMRNVETSVTESKIHYEPFTPGPPEKSLVALATKRESNYYHNTNETGCYTYQCWNMDIKQLTVSETVHWQVVPRP